MKKLPSPEVEGDTPFERFQSLVRRIVTTPKAEIDRREAEYQKTKPGRGRAETK